MSAAIEKARIAWKSGMPDWVEALAQECAASSQNKVAVRLGRSATMISQVLSNTYPGDLIDLEERFRAEFQAAVVVCPALGQIPASDCLAWRKKAREFQNTNSLRIRMFRACRSCKLNRREA